MNKVYLDENGKLFVNENEITKISSVSTKTDWTGTNIIIEFKGDYKSDYIHQEKEHPLNECSKE